MPARRHHLVLVDRSARDGLPHRHRWAPKCDCGCGWRGQFRRRKAEAVEQFRAMVDGSENARRAYEQTHGGRSGRPPMRPRPVTPASDLPEGLR